MSEELQNRAEELLQRLTCKERRMDKLFWVLIGSIIVMAGSISSLTISAVNNRAEINNVREHAFNRDAADKLVDAFNARSRAVEQLIENPETREAVKYFDDQIRKITDDIISWNSAISPRGVISNGEKLNK